MEAGITLAGAFRLTSYHFMVRPRRGGCVLLPAKGTYFDYYFGGTKTGMRGSLATPKLPHKSTDSRVPKRVFGSTFWTPINQVLAYSGARMRSNSLEFISEMIEPYMPSSLFFHSAGHCAWSGCAYWYCYWYSGLW